MKEKWGSLLRGELGVEERGSQKGIEKRRSECNGRRGRKEQEGVR